MSRSSTEALSISVVGGIIAAVAIALLLSNVLKLAYVNVALYANPPTLAHVLQIVTLKAGCYGSDVNWLSCMLLAYLNGKLLNETKEEVHMPHTPHIQLRLYLNLTMTVVPRTTGTLTAIAIANSDSGNATSSITILVIPASTSLPSPVGGGGENKFNAEMILVAGVVIAMLLALATKRGSVAALRASY